MQPQDAVYTIREAASQFELEGHWCKLSREHEHGEQASAGLE
jgi:hypothetical protein